MKVESTVPVLAVNNEKVGEEEGIGLKIKSNYHSIYIEIETPEGDVYRVQATDMEKAVANAQNH